MRVVALQSIVDSVVDAWATHGNQPNFAVNSTHVKNGVRVWNVGFRSGNSTTTGEVEDTVRNVREFWRPRQPKAFSLRRISYLRAQMAKQDKPLHVIVARRTRELLDAPDISVHFTDKVVTDIGIRSFAIPRGEVQWTLCNACDDSEDPYTELLLRAPHTSGLNVFLLQVTCEDGTSTMVDMTCSGLFPLNVSPHDTSLWCPLAMFLEHPHMKVYSSDLPQLWTSVLEKADEESDHFLNLRPLWTATDEASRTAVEADLKRASDERRKAKQRTRKRKKRARRQSCDHPEEVV